MAERLHQGDGSDIERVIVTLRPGTKPRIVQQLLAAGNGIDRDFGLIDAFAGRLPRRLLRILQRHPDVVALSTDAEVGAMGVAGVTGTAQNATYSLRRTLGLDSSIAVGTTTTAQGSTASLSWSHTVAAGSNRLLLVRTAHRDGNKTVSSVKYGSATLTKVAEQNGPGNQNKATLWFLVNPAAGTASVVVTLSGSVKVVAAATTLTGVRQTTPVDSFVTSAAQSTSASRTVTSVPGDLVVDALAANGDALSAAVSGSRDVQWSGGTGTAGGDVRSAGSTTGGASAVTMAWTLGASKPWALVAAVIKPASGTATGLTGAGVTVAVIDSGLLQDGGGTSRIKTTRDFTTGNTNPPAVAPLDGYGHGTHVAGLIGSDKAEAKGVAPGVSYVSLKVLSNLGVGATSHVINAIQWAVANRTTYGIDIINLSLGHPIFEPAATDPLVQAVEAAVRAGIVVVTSAGNNGVNPTTGLVGYAGISSPGNAPSAITAGAMKTQDTTTRTDDLVADYSSRGPTWYDGYAKPDVVAPGHRLVGPAATNQTLYTLFPANRLTLGGRPYLKLSGTSMAAAVTSGSVALMLEGAKATFGVKPPANAVKAMLQHTAFPMGDATATPYHGLAQGAGARECRGRTRGGSGDQSHRGRRQQLAGHGRGRVDHGGRAEHRVGRKHRVGREHRVGRSHLHEPHGLGHQHRVGREHRLGRQHRLGREHRVGRERRLGQQHRLG